MEGQPRHVDRSRDDEDREQEGDADCSIIVIFVQRDIGITSVGLNAVAFVNDVYR